VYLQLYYHYIPFLGNKSSSGPSVDTSMAIYIQRRRNLFHFSLLTLGLTISASTHLRNLYIPRRSFLSAGFRKATDLIPSLGKKFAIQYSKPEDPNELFQKLLEDLKELTEYENSQSRDRPIFLNDDEDHSDQNKESLENSSKEIATSNSNEKKEEPSQDSDIRQLIREECCVEASEEQKQSMEDTMLELLKICRQKELLCIHDNVDDLIESTLNTKLLSINSQRLDNKEQKVKNVVEQPAEHGNRIAPILSTKEPEYSPSMGYEHSKTTPETESDEIIKSGVEELVPILSENEVTLEDKRECNLLVCENSPVCDDHYEIFFDSNNDDDISVYDDDFKDVEYVEASLSDLEIVSVEEENVVQQEEEVDLEDISQIQDVDLREKLLSITRLISNIESLNDNPTPDCVLNSFESDNSLSDNFSPEFETFCDHTEETRSGNTTTHADDSIPKYDSFCFEIEPDQERLINVLKNDISDESTNDPLLEEADLFLASDNSIPSVPLPPSEPPDADFELHFGNEISVVMNKFECLRDEFDDSFMFVKVFSLLSAEREDTIFDPEASEKQKQSMEDTMLELVKICRQKELLCIHDNVDDLIESALNTKLLSINSQRLDNKEHEVKNVVEQPAERGNRSIESLQNFRVVHKSSNFLNNTSQFFPVHEVAPFLSTKEPEYSPSMGYEHSNITSETESDEIIKSGVEELVPIINENEVTLEDKRECNLLVCENSPVCDDHSEIFFDSNNDDNISVYDDDFEDVEYVEASLSDPEIVSVEEENVVQQKEEVDLEDISQIQDVDLREKLLSITQFETFCDHTEETISGNTTTHTDDSLLEHDSFCFRIEPDQERLINVLKNDISDESTNDPLLEEADLFLASDNSILSGIENVANDSEGDIHFLEELLIDDSIPINESSDSNFEDNPSVPLTPPEPPDADFELHLGNEILVVMNKFECLRDEFDDSFMFVKVFSLLSAESEDTIFDPSISD
nr:hypothetical protein [Tanacetum cinerariifolium]